MLIALKTTWGMLYNERLHTKTFPSWKSNKTPTGYKLRYIPQIINSKRTKTKQTHTRKMRTDKNVPSFNPLKFAVYNFPFHRHCGERAACIKPPHPTHMKSSWYVKYSLSIKPRSTLEKRLPLTSRTYIVFNILLLAQNHVFP